MKSLLNLISANNSISREIDSIINEGLQKSGSELNYLFNNP